MTSVRGVFAFEEFEIKSERERGMYSRRGGGCEGG